MSFQTDPTRFHRSARGVLVTLIACAGLALAAPAHAEEKSAARVAYDAGEAEYALGHYREALQKFEEAFKLSRKVQLLFNIAQCHRQLKQMDLAATTYRSFIRADPKNKQVKRAQKLLEQVEQALKSEEKAVRAKPLGLTAQDPSAANEPPAEKKDPAPGVEAPRIWGRTRRHFRRWATQAQAGSSLP